MTPEGRCPTCKLWVFVDGIDPGGVQKFSPRLRQHSTGDPGEIRRAREKAIREGKRSPRLPPCRGSDQGPLELRWPTGDPFLGEKAGVRVEFPPGVIVWEGP